MRKGLKLAALVAIAAVMLAGCSLPMSGFGEYDVSGYFQALLDSSYKGNNTAYMEVAALSEEDAQQNNTTTVQNAAVNFCNTYGISPDDEQLAQLEDVMRQALTQASYTVNEEVKTDTGYTLDVEIDPIVNFNDMAQEIDRLREEAEEEATRAHVSRAYDDDSDEDSYDGYGDDEDGYLYDDGEDSGASDGAGLEDDVVDTNAIFVDKVVELCQEQLGNLRHSGELVTITLDIRQTDAGELQLDTNQLDTIDRTVLQFQS